MLNSNHYDYHSFGTISGEVTQHVDSTKNFNKFGSNSLTGVTNPRWRDQVRLGENATTPASGTMFNLPSSEWYSLQYDGRLQDVGNPRVWQETHIEQYGQWPLPSVPSATPSTSVVTDITNRCIRKFIAAVSAAQTNGNITGRSIRHFSHDVHTLLNPLSGIRTGLTGYLKRIKKSAITLPNAKAVLQDVRDGYLELTFGLKPFSEDIASILSDLSRKRFPTIPVSASASTNYSGSNATQIPGYGPLERWRRNYRTISRYTVRYKGAVRTHSNENGQVSWFQDNQMLPQNWVPTLVSILPYDWLINYFVNLNDVVDSMCFVYSDLAWGCKTIINETTTVCSEWDFNLPTNGVGSYWVYNNKTCYGGNSTYGRKDFTRSVLTPTDLVTKVEFRIPHNLHQYVNMLAVFSPQLTSVVKLLSKFL